ncbi:glutathionylspermidine synthase family protein [Neolewinella persica]|uniref:glutathionylspermidine synthase family protein n=1 Tax=Neolewinella persica TaxID=70998 RepID=UPI00146B16F2|nr:glutathionylspermidine synthase family protein [Neolewinella persica]
MDNRITDAPRLKDRWFSKQGLSFYAEGENEDYLADEILSLHSTEATAAMRAGDEAWDVLRACARKSAYIEDRLLGLGIPDFAVPLIKWSVENEWDNFLVGRFDFAGGLDDLPLKLIEFNADTASLLPETTVLQPEIISKAGLKPAPNGLLAALEANARRLGGGRKDTAIAAAHLGSADDRHNTDVLAHVATAAKWGRVDTIMLPDLEINPDEGVFHEAKPDRWIHYGTMIKFFPWDFAALEEPDLWEYLAELIMARKLRVFNPAWTMLLQSKALLAYAWQDNPGHPLLLPTAFDPADLPRPLDGYVRKPIFGRMGENIEMVMNGRTVVAQTKGDYGKGPVIYQERAQFATDRDKHLYQLSTYQAPQACALCCRRQDDLIIDDDGEFVSLALLKEKVGLRF